MLCVHELEPSPLRLPTLHSGSSSIFQLNAHLRFAVYGRKHGCIDTHTSAQCNPASVGLTQAHPNQVSLPCDLAVQSGIVLCPDPAGSVVWE